MIHLDFKTLFQNKWLLLLAALGVLFILVGTFWNHSGGAVATLGKSVTAGSTSAGTGGQVQSTAATTAADPISQMEASYDSQLTQIVNQLQGVNSSVVMVTLDSSNQLSVANNVKTTTQTQKGGAGQTSSSSTTTDNSVFTARNTDGSQVPFVTEQRSPQVRGVVVLVDAKDFFVAKSEIINAIGHVLDVPAYKISVEPKRSNP